MHNCSYCNETLDEHSLDEIQLCYYKNKMKQLEEVE